MLANVDAEVVVITVALALFIATDTTLVEGIRRSAPSLAPRLGWLGPAYWLFSWFRPAYRRFMKHGRFDAELSAHPKLLRLAQAERLLWYLSLFAIAAVILL
jgi:hypothetical protein